MTTNSRSILVLALGFVSACTAQGSDPTIGSAGGDTDALSADACPTVPAAIAINKLPGGGADQRLAFKRFSSGTQVYVCTKSEAGVYAWTFVNPVANMWKESGDLAGTHFIGPHWQGNDGSIVKGSLVARAPAANPTADIPWLLIAGSNQMGPGKFENITTIQRLNTVGGVAPPLAAAPAAGCTVGAIANVPYETDYFFYDTRTPGNRPNPQCN